MGERDDRVSEVEQRSRLREVSRKAGARIRAHLEVEQVIGEARMVIESDLGADVAYLHLLDEHGNPGPPIGHEHDWIMPEAFLEDMWRLTRPFLEELFRAGGSLVIQDLASPEWDRSPPEIIEPLRAVGAVSHVLTPFGGGEQMIGFIAAERFQRGRPWTQPEIEAVESIAADIGRGLHHARLYERERRLVGELQALNEMRTEFFTTVAHELRSPLTAIEGYVEMLGEGEGGPVTPAQRGMLEAVEHGAKRLRGLIDDLFTLAKVESGAGGTGTETVDLAAVISRATEAVGPAAAAGGLTLTSPFLSRDLVVTGDGGQLDMLAANLLSNAVKFTRAGGEVSVCADAEDGWAVVTVRDTGIGIPEADLGRIFTRFFRAANAVERQIPGTGLGLAIAQAIAVGHGGEVSVESREGTGTTVTVRLPLAASVSVHPATPAGSGDR